MAINEHQGPSIGYRLQPSKLQGSPLSRGQADHQNVIGETHVTIDRYWVLLDIVSQQKKEICRNSVTSIELLSFIPHTLKQTEEICMDTDPRLRHHKESTNIIA